MNVRQRRAITEATIMRVAQERVVAIFAMPSSEQSAAWDHAIADANEFDDIEVARGCIRVYSAIVEQAVTFS